MNLLAGLVVVAVGVGLIGLAGLIAFGPRRAERFLALFASSARAHYTEQTTRLVAGVAIVLFAPSMHHPRLFAFFGWLLVATAVGLLLIPWRWHHRFGQWAIPLVLRHLRLYGVGALVLGVLLLYGVSRAVLT